MPSRIQRSRARIDGISYADGAQACIVVFGGRTVYRTRRYRRENRDGTVPAMRALRVARNWAEAHADVLIEIANG